MRELRQVRDHPFTSPLQEHEQVRGMVHTVVVKDGVEVAAMCWSFAVATDLPFADVPTVNRCPECTRTMENQAAD